MVALCVRMWYDKLTGKLEFDEQLENLYFMQKSKKGVRKNERELVVEN